MIALHNFIYAISILLTIAIILYAWTHRHKPGAKELLLIMIFVIFWNITSMLELAYDSIETKVFWRNMQQISGFMIPYLVFLFTHAFIENKKMTRYAQKLIVFPIIWSTLIFTNSMHGLVRYGYSLHEVMNGFDFLIIQVTPLGFINVLLNLAFMAISVVYLIFYYQKTIGQVRTQVKVMIYGIVFTTVMFLANNTILRANDIYIMSSIFYTPGVIMLSYALFRYEFFNISPLSKDKLLASIPEMIIVMDAKGEVIEFNDSAQTFFEDYYGVSLSLGLNLYETWSVNFSVNVEAIASRKNTQYISVTKAKSVHHFSLNFHPLMTHQKYHGIMILIDDITLEYNYELALKTRAETDALTRLYDRTAFQTYYDALRGDHKGMILFDIDDFKAINDTHGHHIGDAVLTHLSHLIQTLVPSACIVGRLGGEEFAVGCQGLATPQLKTLAETIRQTVEDNALTVNDQRIAVTISVGYSVDELANKLFDKIRHEADIALYNAKSQQKNNVKAYSEPLKH